MTKVLAFDQASTTGWTFGGTKIELREWLSGHFRAPKRDEVGERLTIIEDDALTLIDRHQPDIIAIETPYNPIRELIEDVKAGRRVTYNAGVVEFLHMVKGGVLMAAARRGIPTEEYLSRSWRATLKLPQKPPGADQNWIKRETREAVRRMGATVGTFDEADSWGICFHACHGKPGIERATADLFERARASLG